MALDADSIETAAEEPKSASVDGQSVTQRPVKELLDAVQHKAAQAAKDGGTLGGIQMRKIEFGSAIGP